MRKQLAGWCAGTFVLSTAFADDSTESFVAVAAAPSGQFAAGAKWHASPGWHADSGADAAAEAVAACQEASGTLCWPVGIPSMRGGCVALVLGTWTDVYPGEEPRAASRFFQGAAAHNDRGGAEKWAVDSCADTIPAGKPDGTVQSWRCDVEVSFCSSDVAQGLKPAAAGPETHIDPADACPGKPEGSACWMEIQSRPGCYVWNSHLQADETAIWSGRCDRGVAVGAGTSGWSWPDGSASGQGELVRGKRHGRWILWNSGGDFFEGPYVDGKRDGQWIERFANGTEARGHYMAGARAGLWAVQYTDGDEREIPFVDDKPHGTVVERRADGTVCYTEYVNGDERGQRCENPADPADASDCIEVEGSNSQKCFITFTNTCAREVYVEYQPEGLRAFDDYYTVRSSTIEPGGLGGVRGMCDDRVVWCATYEPLTFEESRDGPACHKDPSTWIVTETP